jgi:hypothetical protein
VDAETEKPYLNNNRVVTMASYTTDQKVLIVTKGCECESVLQVQSNCRNIFNIFNVLLGHCMMTFGMKTAKTPSPLDDIKDFYILLTVHLDVILVNGLLDALFLNVFILCLYMFRATSAHHQEGQIVLIHHLV